MSHYGPRASRYDLPVNSSIARAFLRRATLSRSGLTRSPCRWSPAAGGRQHALPPTLNGALTRWFIALGALLFPLLAIQCSQSPSLRFVVAPCRHGPGQLDVTLAMQGAIATPLVLRGYAPAEYMRISNVSIMGSSSQPLTFAHEALIASDRRRSYDVPRFVVTSPDPKGVTIHYCVRPGLETGDAHDEFAGTSFGVVTGDFVFVRGRQLFLLPESVNQEGTLEVAFDPEFPGEIVVPWPGEDRVFRPDKAVGHRGREALIAATVGIGEFTRTAISRPRTTYEFAVARSIPSADAAAALDPMSRIIRSIDKITSPELGERYLTTIAPRLATGASLVGEAWLNGQGGTFVPATLNSLRTFARGLMTTVVRDRPSPLSAVRNDLRWLQDGAIEFHAWQALVAAGVLSETEVTRFLAHSYLQSLGQEAATCDLTTAYDGGRPPYLVREIVAPLAYAIVADEVRAAGIAPADSAYLLHSMLYARGTLTLESILADVPAEKRSFLEHSVIRGRLTEFLDRFAFVPATSPTPRDPCSTKTTDLRIVYTGNTEGYLENCGCKVNEAGGIARRATALMRLRSGNAHTMVLDAGNFTPVPSKRASSQDSIEAQEGAFYASFMARSSYNILFPSTYELALAPSEWPARYGSLAVLLQPPDQDAPGSPDAAYRRFRIDDLTVAAFAVFDPAEVPSRPARFLERVRTARPPDPVDQLRAGMEAAHRSADLIVVGGNLRPSTLRRLAEAYPDIDVLVSTEDDLEPITRLVGDLRGYSSTDQQGFLGDTLVLYPTSGKYGVDTAQVRLDNRHHICSATFSSILLDDAIPEEARTRRDLNAFYSAIEAGQRPGSGRADPAPASPAREPLGLVGAQECRPCHESEYTQWQKTGHASAYKTLLDRHRHFHPRCIGCHVLGYGERDGFQLSKPDQRLANVQCESCHGPGMTHVGSPSVGNIRRHVDAQVCLGCHDPAHSDHFEYETRISRVRHTEAPELARSVPVPRARQ